MAFSKEIKLFSKRAKLPKLPNRTNFDVLVVAVLVDVLVVAVLVDVLAVVDMFDDYSVYCLLSIAVVMCLISGVYVCAVLVCVLLTRASQRLRPHIVGGAPTPIKNSVEDINLNVSNKDICGRK